MNLKLVEPGKGDTEKLFSIYDGNKIVFRQSSWSVLTLGRMIWRYGLSYFMFQPSPTAMLRKFLNIYKELERNAAFDSPAAMLRKVGLYDLTQQNMRTAVQVLLQSCYAFSRPIVLQFNRS